MDTSRVDGVKASLHDKTPRYAPVDLGGVLVFGEGVVEGELLVVQVFRDAVDS